MYLKLSSILLAVLAACAITCASAQAQPFWGYNAIQGACPAYSWNTAGTDCTDSTKINQQRFALAADRPAVYRMRAQYNICEAYIAVGQDCFTFFDKAITWAAQHNQKVLLVVTQSNNAGADYNGYRFPQTTTELARYKEWWRKLTIKYGNDSRVIGAEVWNEPNGNTVFTGGLNIGPTEYAKGACAALNGRNEGRLTTGNPRLKLYLGALAWNTSGITPGAGVIVHQPSTHMGLYMRQTIQALTPTQGCPSKYMGPLYDIGNGNSDTDPDQADGTSIHMYNGPQINWTSEFFPGQFPSAHWRTSPNLDVNFCSGQLDTDYHRVNGCNLALSVWAHNLWYRTVVGNGGTSTSWSYSKGQPTAGKVLISEIGFNTTPNGGEPGASTWSQSWAVSYLRDTALAALNTDQVIGVYYYPLQSFGTTAGIDTSGFWNTSFAIQPGGNEFLASLQHQTNNPTLYP